MRKLALAAIAAASLAGASALTLSSPASAQTAASPPPPPAAAMPMPGMMHGSGSDGRMGERGGAWMRGGEMRRVMSHLFSTWGLFHRPADLALTPDDVKVLGEAILLRNGQHDWKVGEVTPNADHTVSFAFVTAHGDVVARFAINTQTGRISRTD